ncbi:hypothetical protein ARALYDRAFT_898987 [Arabidopsis lyrata subsp. lyrata]|uniref:Wall-associated receptor kinase-like n=2 Tax=Arabidopsis lyrata subsp. lyrata TaxID=81972 RepID=D7L4B8_ARALL|nr:hypothetical protein ARALYDRAFT_898987 [Arabidopsis lyrata subsp. lyrata]
MFLSKMKNVFLLLVHLALAIFGSALAKNNCQRNCGSVSIPYPFGIGEACYLSKWHEVQCHRNPASGQLLPFLPGINKTVLQINLPRQRASTPYGSIRIQMDIFSTGCGSPTNVFLKFDGNEVGDVLNLTGTPFVIGRANDVVGIGCNIKASLRKIEPRIVGCVSTCAPEARMDKKGCNGYICCRKKAPDVIGQVTGLSILGDSINTTIGRCKVAFLTDEFDRYPSSKISDPRWFYAMKHTTVQLRWSIQTVNRSSIGCSDHRCKCHNLTEYEYEIGYSTCACSSGYNGNPYLLGGCKDIDECRILNNDGRPRYCRGGSMCVNTPGGYHCVFHKNKALPIIIGVGTSFGVLISVGVAFWLYVIIKRQRQINRKKRFFKRNGGLLLQQQLNSTAGSIDKIIVFTSNDLNRATENFSVNRVLGKGGQGTVYKGMLVDGRIVAVKKSTSVDEHRLEHFINELVILAQINHRNIVKVLGCCLETEVPTLVYEFVPNGDLSNLLHHGSDNSPWELRLAIAVDIAGALSYLHSDASIKIYHRDIKSSNIMLDENRKAKLSDFGISRSVNVANTHLITEVAGTAGYMDPEYFQTMLYTDKSDVYSFGVVLVELITGEKTVTQQNRCLARDFALAVKESRLVEVIDVKLKDNHNIEQVTAVASLARRCVSPRGPKRPTMREVSVELERIRSLQLGAQPMVDSDEENEVLQFDINWDSSASTSQFQTAATSESFLLPPGT